MTDRHKVLLAGPSAALGAGLHGAAIRSRLVGWLPAALLVAAVVLLVAVPLVGLLDAALEQGLATIVDALRSSGGAVAASISTSLGAAILAVAIGTAMAVLTERTEVPGRRGLRVAMLVAFIVPGYVAAIGWLNAYAPGGLLDDTLGLAAPALVGPLGVVIVLAVEAMPIAYLVVAAGLATRVEPDLERAARASGATVATVFRTVTLPLLAPVVAAAGAIAFVLSLTSFGVPAVLGIPAGFSTMTTRIYRDLAFSSDPLSFARAVALALLLAVLAAILIALADALLERRRADRSGAFGGPLGAIGPSRTGSVADSSMSPRRRPRAFGTGLVAWGLMIILVGIPLLALLLTALTRAPGLAPVPANWSLDSFRLVLDGQTLSALGNSAILSSAAAGGVMLLAGLAIVARRGRGPGITGGVLGLSFALPGSTLAIAVLLAYGIALRDTLIIILVAYLAKFWALGYRPVAAGLDSIPADVYHAARVSGADAVTATRTVVLPLLRPLLIAAGLIVFMFGLHEVTMSSLLYGPGSATLGVVVLNLQQLGEANLTAALAVVLTVIVALASLPLLARSGALERVGWRR